MNMKYLLACGVAAVSIGAAMADPKPTVFPHGIAGSSNVMTSAGAVQGTLSDTVTKAQGSVQQSTANQPNGYAKPDAGGNVTLPVTGSVAAAPADASGDTVSTIAATAKSGSALAATAVQKSQVGAANGVAPLDSQTMMSAAVSGDSSASPISKIVAPGNATYPNTVTRTVSQHFSDLPNLRDFGMQLAPNEGAPDITWLQNYWSGLTGSTPAILPAGSHWPDNAYVPDSGSSDKTGFVQFPVVTAFGTVSHRPGYNTQWGYGVPYYGDVVPSLTHDDASFEFARVDGNFASAGLSVPVVRVDQILDTPYEGGANGTGGNQFALTVNTATSPRVTHGTISNTNNTFISQGYNYWNEMDVNSWTHTRINGTNWAWDNIQEMYEETPFYCDPSDSGLCFPEYMNEEDMYGIGPENPESAYDPMNTRRQMFWLTTNHNINHNNTPSVRWSASMLVPAHKIITVVDSATGHEFMFEGVHTGYSGNSTTSITGSITGNTLTVTSTSSTIVPGKTYIFDGTISDEVIISAQTSGTSGGAGVYTIKSQLNPTGFDIPKSTTFTVSAASSARFSVTGTTEPKWTFATGDTFTDGTTTWKCIGPWQYDIGAIIKVGGANNESSGYRERIGTLMAEETDEIYNAIFDMSKAAFDPNITNRIFARLQKNMYFDFTADGTQAGQNNALFGYNSSDSALEYKRNGSTILQVNDDTSVNVVQKINAISGTLEFGTNAQANQDLGIYGRLNAYGPLNVGGLTTLSGGLVMASKTKADILALTSPAEGTSYFDTDDHVQVTYRCPTTSTCGWYPVQYGAALSN